MVNFQMNNCKGLSQGSLCVYAFATFAGFHPNCFLPVLERQIVGSKQPQVVRLLISNRISIAIFGASHLVIASPICLSQPDQRALVAISVGLTNSYSDV